MARWLDLLVDKLSGPFSAPVVVLIFLFPDPEDTIFVIVKEGDNLAVDVVVVDVGKEKGSWTTDTNLINGPKFFWDFIIIIKKIFFKYYFYYFIIPT